MRISVVSPVFNSSQSVPDLVRSVMEKLEGKDFELVLVDDGSSDGSWEAISNESAKFSKNVRSVRLSRNYGQHAATLAGCYLAKGDIIVTLDDDLQFPASEIMILVSELENNSGSVIYGVPEKRRASIVRRLLSKMYKLVFEHGFGVLHASKISSFRAFESRLIQDYRPTYGTGFSIDAILAWTTDSFRAVSVQHSNSARGDSRYRIKSLFVHFLDMLTSFSLRPLRMVSAIGLGSSLIGLFLIIYLIANYLLGSPPDGFTWLASTLVFFAGVQMFITGVIGEYIGRIHWSTQEKPLFLVSGDSDSTNAKKGEGTRS